MQHSFRFHIDPALLDLLSRTGLDAGLSIRVGPWRVADLSLSDDGVDAIVAHGAACVVECVKSESGALHVSLSAAQGWAPEDILKSMLSPWRAYPLPERHEPGADHVMLSGASGGGW
ncbi:hypothetical protein DK842_20045 [Chromobacterium phragmitis]|uniref:hypothetical protein n=1 Tax=Chromobacterium phragmitis TaxID=2202141 RepID=UPI000DECDB2B|nr:hypothetical protein [Chromobacterium phragmitis]AXE31983.1 hypothetical protein DK842_20045 [Chromobacterium phragmitis]